MQLYTLLGPGRKPYPSQTPGRYGGYRPGKLYGRLDCPSALRAIAGGSYVQHRVCFADQATAIAAGYHRPCAVCLPARHTAWKGSREARMRVTQQQHERSSSARQKAAEQAAAKQPRTTEAAAPWQ